jgi:hypothetical protein
MTSVAVGVGLSDIGIVFPRFGEADGASCHLFQSKARTNRIGRNAAFTTTDTCSRTAMSQTLHGSDEASSRINASNILIE